MDNTKITNDTVALVVIDNVKVVVTLDHAMKHTDTDGLANAMLREIFTGREPMSSKVFKNALRKGIEAACFCCAQHYCKEKGVTLMPYKIEIL
jgi:hypothetical protein